MAVSLASFQTSLPKRFEGKRLGIFSYGSGLASALFSMKVVGDTTEMAEKLNLQERLDNRKVVAPEVYDEVSTVSSFVQIGINML